MNCDTKDDCFDGSDEELCGSYMTTQGVLQGSHKLEKYLNIQDCLEKSLKKNCFKKYLKNTQRP